MTLYVFMCNLHKYEEFIINYLIKLLKIIVLKMNIILLMCYLFVDVIYGFLVLDLSFLI